LNKVDSLIKGLYLSILSESPGGRVEFVLETLWLITFLATAACKNREQDKKGPGAPDKDQINVFIRVVIHLLLFIVIDLFSFISLRRIDVHSVILILSFV